MKVVTRHIHVDSRKDEIKITPIGDVHIGGRDCDKKLLEQCVEKIASEDNHYWLGMGDFGEFINYRDKRFDPSELDDELKIKDLADLAKCQSDMIARRLLPIKDKCLGLLSGNHEETIRLRHDQDIHWNLCNAMYSPENKWGMQSANALDLGYSSIIRVRIFRSSKEAGGNGGGNPLFIYAHHGSGGGRKSGSKINRLEDAALTFPYCHIYVMGHVHDRAAWLKPALHIAERSDTIIQKWRAFGITGTFKKTYQQDAMGYGEKLMLPATALGVITFSVTYEGDRLAIAAHNATSGLPA